MEEALKCTAVAGQLKLICQICDKAFFHPRTRNQHMRKFHHVEPIGVKKNSVRNICPISDCREKFFRMNTLRDHLIQIHEIKLEVQEKIFRSYEDFWQWKENMERETKSHYVTRLSYTRKRVHKRFFACDRSGSYTTRGAGNKRRRIRSKRMRAFCPASLVVLRSTVNSYVKVIHWRTHLGHKCDMNHLPLTKREKMEIAGPISFSLRAKEPDTVPTEKTKIPLLLDDSDDEDSGADAGEKSGRVGGRKSTEDRSTPTSRHHSVEREEKPKMSSEIEAKLGLKDRFRLKDKLLSAARERMVQQKREKRLKQERQKWEEQARRERQAHTEQQRRERELQAERKMKAALFLRMLKSRRDPDATGEEEEEDQKKSDFWNLVADGEAVENGILFPLPKIAKLSRRRSCNLAIPGIKSDWSGSSDSEESGEEIMITEFCSNPDASPNSAAAPVPKEKSPEPQRKHKKKGKRCSKSRDRHSSRRSSRSRCSRSPRNSRKSERTKKE